MGIKAGAAASAIAAQLKTVALFHGLSEPDLAPLAERCRRRRFGAGEALFHEGDPGQTLYLVVSGRVTIERVTKTGETVHIAERGPGEHFGEMALFDEAPRSADAVTAVASDLLLLDRQNLMHFLEAHPAIAWNVIRALASRLREASDQTLRHETLDVTGRLAAFLLREARTAAAITASPGEPARGAANVPMRLPRLTTEQIAHHIGARRESVSRSLSRLTAVGAVRRDGHALLVTSRSKLRALCGDANQ